MRLSSLLPTLPVQFQRPAKMAPSFNLSAPAADTFSLQFAGKANAVADKNFVDVLKDKGAVVSGGGGTMGSAIALNMMNYGFPVAIHDAKDAFVQGGRDKIEAQVAKAVSKGIITEDEANDVRAKLTGGYSNDTFANIPKDAAIVVEAIFENETAKRELFQKLDAHMGPDTILATNTSSLSVDDLAAATNRPDRFIGLHYFLPAHQNRFIEVVPGKLTSPETVKKTMAFVRSIGKTPILCKDAPGYVVNRMLVPYMNEGIKIWDEERASFIDTYKRTNNGQEPSAKALKDVERKLSTTIEQAAKEVLWPTYSKLGLGLGPMSGLNMPEYMGLIGEITEILHNGLGEGYKPAKTTLAKSEAFRAINWREPDAQAKFDALKFELSDKPEDMLTNRLQGFKDRFEGLMIGVAAQIINDGIATPEDINRGCQVATQWELSPIDHINSIGAERALELVEKYNQTNPDFTVANILKTNATSGKGFDINYVQSRVENGVSTITINKPQRANMLDQGMLDGLKAAFEKAEADPKVKKIVFESVGGKHFVSGADIFAVKDTLTQALMSGAQPDEVYPKVSGFLKSGVAVFDAIAKSSKPTIAKVNGTALGGGLELALACDYVVASEEASLGLPELKYGIFPAWGGTERTQKRAGTHAAKALMALGALTDEKGRGPGALDAKTAAALGLVDAVVPPTDLDKFVEEGLANGDFDNKTKKLSAKKATQRLAANLSNPDLTQIVERFKTADVDSLLNNEFKPLYEGFAKASELKAVYKNVLTLAFNRIERGRFPAKATQEVELQQMVSNMIQAEMLKMAGKA